MYIVIYEIVRKGQHRKFMALPDTTEDVMEADKMAQQTAAKTKARSWIMQVDTPPTVEPVAIPTQAEIIEYEKLKEQQRPQGVPFNDK